MASGTDYAPLTEGGLFILRSRMPQNIWNVPDPNEMKRRQCRGRYNVSRPGPLVAKLHVPLSRMFRDYKH
jgi:hypothetical protein